MVITATCPCSTATNNQRIVRNLVRLAMLAAVIILPPIVGLVSLLVVNPEDRPKGATGKTTRILRGYTLTPRLAATLLMLTTFAPIMKVQTVSRRWIGQHMPVLVEPDDYVAVAEDIQKTLKEAGWDTRRGLASWMIRFPTKVITLLAGGGVKNLVAEKLRAVEHDLKDAKIPFEEWKVLFREKLLVERGLLAEETGVASEAGSPAAARHVSGGAARRPAERRMAFFVPALATVTLLVMATFAWRSLHAHH